VIKIDIFSFDDLCLCFFFFFSSRRRHTRCYRDWSSDVCSSDLGSTWIPTIPPARALLSTYCREAGSAPTRTAARHGAMPCRAVRSEERRVGEECGCGGSG